MNYQEFVKKYGDRPKDIVFNMARLLAYEEIISKIERWEEHTSEMFLHLRSEGMIAADRGHLWPVAEALRKEFNCPKPKGD